jgi:quercetin dioxygenase-like cupin family protein
MPFVELSDIPSQEKLPGCHVRFVHTENMTFSYWRLETGAQIPRHAHPHEQVTTLIEGVLELTVGTETKTIRPGFVGVIPSHTDHAATAIAPCYVLDVFYPVREDYR